MELKWSAEQKALHKLKIMEKLDEAKDQAHNEDSVELNKYYVTLITEGNTDAWYLATCVGKNNNGTYKMDHLFRVNKKSNLKWKNPTSPYILRICIQNRY